MDQNIILICSGATIFGLIIGLIISKIKEKNNATQITKNANRTAEEIISKAQYEGETKKKRYFKLRSDS